MKKLLSIVQGWMQETVIDRLRELLHSQSIEVSYFAAGIVAHLAR